MNPVFIECAIYGSHHSSLEDSFLMFLSPAERDLVKCALDRFEEVDNTDLLEFLESHHCRKLPSKDNVKSIVLELAHKELIQAPKYVIVCFAVILKVWSLFQLKKLLKYTKHCSRQ